MNHRREFLRMSAGAVALGALSSRSPAADEDRALRQVWVLSDLHCGLKQDGKDGVEWFAAACQDLQQSGLRIDHALTLGDITHNGTESELQGYLKARTGSGIARWHELAGNHEYQKDGSIEPYTRLVGSTDPQVFIDGNIAWLLLSDQKAGVQGDLTEEACQWLEQQLAKHQDKIVIVCSHQLVKATVFASEQASRHLHPADRIQAIIEKFRIDLWLCGHEHHCPYTPKHIARVGQTTYINIASMHHAYRTGASQSCILEFNQGASEIRVRRRQHDNGGFLEPFETRVPLRHSIRLQQA